jgi:uncharacterized membrane protein
MYFIIVHFSFFSQHYYIDGIQFRDLLHYLFALQNICVLFISSLQILFTSPFLNADADQLYSSILTSCQIGVPPIWGFSCTTFNRRPLIP